MKKGTYRWYIIDLNDDDEDDWYSDADNDESEIDEVWDSDEDYKAYAIEVELYDKSIIIEDYMKSRGFDNMCAYTPGFDTEIYGLGANASQEDVRRAAEDAGLVFKEKGHSEMEIHIIYAIDWSFRPSEGGPFVAILTERYWHENHSLSDSWSNYSEREVEALNTAISNTGCNEVQESLFELKKSIIWDLREKASNKNNNWRGFKSKIKNAIDLVFYDAGLELSSELQNLLDENGKK